MSVISTHPGAPLEPQLEAPADTRRARVSAWTLIDASLLALVIILSSDMLVQVRVLQSPLWLYCYGIVLVRVAVMLPYFLPVLGRNWIVMVYPAICLASVLWSADPGRSLTGALQLSMTMLMGVYVGWRYSMTVLLKVLAVSLSLAIGLSILHWAFGIFPWPVYTRIGGLAGLFSSKNMLGLRALFGITAIIALLMMSRREVGPVFRQLAIVALCANVFALSISKSITSILLVGPMLGVLIVLCWKRIPPLFTTLGVVLALVIVSLGPVFLVIAQINPIEEILGAVGKSTTLTGRTRIWAVAIEVYRDQPILGTGYRAFWYAPEFANQRLMTVEAGATTSRSFHSFVLEILVSAGWAAVLAMLALIWVSTQRMAQVLARTGSVAMAGGLALMAGVVISSLTGSSLYRGHEIMIVLVVAFAVTAGEDLYRMRHRSGGEPPPVDDPDHDPDNGLPSSLTGNGLTGNRPGLRPQDETDRPL